MGYLFADNSAKLGVNFLLNIAMTATTVENVRTVADVALVFVGPLDKRW
jgi:hypothetical protein